MLLVCDVDAVLDWLLESSVQELEEPDPLGRLAPVVGRLVNPDCPDPG